MYIQMKQTWKMKHVLVLIKHVLVETCGSWNVVRLCNKKCFNFFWRLFHVFIALYVTAFLQCDFILKDFTLSIPFLRAWYFISMCIRRKYKRIIETFKWLILQRFTEINIFSWSLIMSDSENKELVWSNLPLKCIVLMVFFYIINIPYWLNFLFGPKLQKHSLGGSQKLHDKLILKFSLQQTRTA